MGEPQPQAGTPRILGQRCAVGPVFGGRACPPRLILRGDRGAVVEPALLADSGAAARNH